MSNTPTKMPSPNQPPGTLVQEAEISGGAGDLRRDDRALGVREEFRVDTANEIRSVLGSVDDATAPPRLAMSSHAVPEGRRNASSCADVAGRPSNVEIERPAKR